MTGATPATLHLETEARPAVQLLAGHGQRLRHGAPWVFSNEVKFGPDLRRLAPGTLVELRDPAGHALGSASFNPHSLICARLWSEDAATPIDRAFFAVRLRAALELRRRFFDRPYYRLVHAEADRLPGVVIDRYGDLLSLQTNTAGAERLLPEILAALDEVLAPAAVLLKNDSPIRALEGLPCDIRVAKGAIPGPIEIVENGARFQIDLLRGQKTGWFYDLAAARAMAAPLAAGGRMLDLYSHTGGFAIQGALAGATEVLAIERSETAIALARTSAALNAVAERCHFDKADVFAALARLNDEGARFRLLVADPPSFVKAKKDLPSGIKAYRKLTRLAAPLVAPSGFFFIASCSHHVGAEAFAAEVARGLQQARRSGRILAAAGAGPDHPLHPALPETAYLKWQLLQLD